MKTAIAALLALGVLANGVAARTVFDDIQDSAPRSIFDDIRDTAPRSPFDQLADTAPRSFWQQLDESAPRSDGVFGDLERDAP